MANILLKDASGTDVVYENVETVTFNSEGGGRVTYYENGSGGGSGVGVQADWAQNDSTQPDYIKNKPFGGDVTETVVFEEQELEFIVNADTLLHSSDTLTLSRLPKSGDVFLVSWDTEKYSCIVSFLEDEGVFVAGNLSVYGLGDNTKEPFLVVMMEYDGSPSMTISTADKSSSHTAAIYQVEGGIKKLDPKYLPDISADWETMANKPFYETEAVETELLSKQELSFVENPMFEGLYYSTADNVPLSLNEKYVVVWDDKEYDVTAVSYDLLGGNGIGNPALLGMGDNTGEPFAIGETGAPDAGEPSIVLFTADNSESHEVSIRHVVVPSEIHKIDPKYLPDGMVADWNTMINKPFGEEVELEELLPISNRSFTYRQAEPPYQLHIEATDEQDALWNSDWIEAYVQWEDKVYTVKPQHIDGIKAAGNYNLLMGTGDTGEPFGILCLLNLLCIYSLVDAAPEDTSNAPVIDRNIGITLKMHEAVHKIDEKYLPILDYTQIDGADILPLTEFTDFTLNEFLGVYVASEVTGDWQITVGETYSVMWDGEVYNCVAQDASVVEPGSVALGNATGWGLFGNNEPFILGLIGGSLIPISFTDTEEGNPHTVRIYKPASESYKINNKYLNFIIGESEEIVPEQIVSGFLADDAIVVAPNPIVAGKTYTVVWDGNSYSCIAYLIPSELGGIEGVIALGNKEYIEGLYNEIMLTPVEPFLIQFIPSGAIPVLPQDTIMAICFDGTCTSDTHTVGIYCGSEKIDPKYLPDSIGDVSWNDLTDKPFGYTDEVIFDNNVQFTDMDDGVYVTSNNQNIFAVVSLGKNYKIVFDGFEYMCEAKDVSQLSNSMSGSLYLGNSMLILKQGLGENTGEPFVITVGTDDNALGAFTNASGDSHNIAIYELVVQKLDADFLPDMLPEVTTADAGKFLRVSADGKWVAESIPNAEEASF